MKHAGGLNAIVTQRELHVQRELMEFEQMIAFEMESDGALEKVGGDGNDLRVVESGPERHFLCAGREIHPIIDCALIIGHASPFWRELAGRV